MTSNASHSCVVPSAALNHIGSNTGARGLQVFDILFYNGRSLLGETFKARRALLERVAHPIRNYVELSCAYDVTTKEQLEALMQEAVAARLEGLMLKDKGGAYECNMRR